VAPVLDPSWQNPYAPSTHERHENQRAVRAYAVRRKLPQTIIVGVVVIALIVGVVALPWLPAVAAVLAALYLWQLRSSVLRFEKSGESLGASLLETFTVGGTTKDRQRLITVIDRLVATFGVDAVSAFIVGDPGYNAALVPDGQGLSFFVTDSMMRDFELIELEGVVAHCLARHRLGLLERQGVASVGSLSEAQRQVLAGPSNAYRADEVAAAAIRYPLGIAGALRHCASQVLPPTSYFASPAYAKNRWIWFDVWSDRQEINMSDLDDVELRARALEEW
jgi:uncharacterized membrane protein YbaN (DUF454 family)